MVSNRRRKINNKRGPSEARNADKATGYPEREVFPAEPPPLLPLTDAEKRNRLAALALARKGG